MAEGYQDMPYSKGQIVLNSGITASNNQLKKYGQVVFIYINPGKEDGFPQGTTIIGTIPEGFRPSNTTESGLLFNDKTPSGQLIRALAYSNGTLEIQLQSSLSPKWVNIWIMYII